MFGSFRVWIAVPRTMPRPATPPPPKHVQETYALRGSSRPRANASSNPETEISCCLWVWMLSRVREQDPRNCWNFAVARLFAVGQKLFSIRWLVSFFLEESSSRRVLLDSGSERRIRKNVAMRGRSWRIARFSYFCFR